MPVTKKAAKTDEIQESDIRIVKWMLKKGKTKKACCEQLGIAYNTKRLDKILEDFDAKLAREEELKTKAKNKVFTRDEMKTIAQAYLDGETQSGLAKQFFVSPQKIKKMLIEMNVPIRARGKKKAANVEHVVQDLDVKFAKGQKVFVPSLNTFGFVEEVFDEDWIDIHREPINKRYVELHGMEQAQKKHGPEFEGREDVHWNIYWQYENEPEWKQFAIKERIKDVESVIEETGREFYRLWVGDNENQGHFMYANRDKLFPVEIK
jgi:hypothetical protein